MKRMKVLFGNRRMMVMLTLAILVLAAAAIIASSASFTSNTVNVSNTFATGDLTLSDGVITFTPKLWPGQAKDGTCGVTVTADGGTAQLWLQVTSFPASPSVADRLTLDVFDSTGTSHVAGPFDITGAELQDGVQIATGLTSGAQTYIFRIAWRDSDLNGGATLADKGADNPYKNTTAPITFGWTAASE